MNVAIWLLAFLFAASALFNPNQSNAADRIKIALTTVGGSFLAGGVAARKGFFQQEGFDAELVQVNVNVALTALLNGDLDYSLLFGSTVRAAVRGLPVKALASFMDAPTQSLIGRENIKTIADLKGKKVLISSFGASAHSVALLILRHFGIQPGEVNFVAGGPDRARLAMLEQGLADASILNPFAVAMAEKLGFRVIARAYELFSFPSYGFGATDKKIREQRDVTKRALKALIRASQYIRENREGTIQVLMDWAKEDRQTATADYDTIRLISSSDGSIPEKGLRLWIDESKAALKTDREVPFSEVADFSVLAEVQKELTKVTCKRKQVSRKICEVRQNGQYRVPPDKDATRAVTAILILSAFPIEVVGPPICDNATFLWMLARCISTSSGGEGRAGGWSRKID